MYIPLHGCCTESPGCDDLATSRQVFLAVAWVFGGASLLILALNLFLY